MTPQIKEHEEAYGRLKKRTIMVNNFLGGISWGVGTVIGASVVVGALGYILNALGIVDAFRTIFGR
ncbi:MAG: DUF5665 domain-containing protein [Candidatus Daviesbacteria bacterium]|nr:DUF5665 domain-containing protein [Candidatus Daviesbacteria bacterium]